MIDMQNIAYRFKILLQNKPIIFWTLCFPMILSVFFNIALKDAYTITTITTTDVAVVVKDESLLVLIEQLETEYGLIEGKVYADKNAAITALEQGEVAAVIDDTDGVQLTFTAETYNTETTILDNIFKSYNMKQALIQEQLEKDPSVVTADFLSDLVKVKSFLQVEGDENSEQTYVIHFYTAIAMLCLYASHWGNCSGRYLQADMSSIGIRNNISPTRKFVIILQDLGVVFTIFLVEFAIFISFLKFVLDVPFGNNLGLVIATGLAGGLLTSMLGYMICVSVKGSEHLRVNIISGIGVFMSFLSGMMVVGMKHLIDTHAPFLAKINPAALITDNFYWIFKGTHTDVVLANIGIMLLMTFLFGLVAYFRMKGESYDHL